jgi:hypothetical protein
LSALDLGSMTGGVSAPPQLGWEAMVWVGRNAKNDDDDGEGEGLY